MTRELALLAAREPSQAVIEAVLAGSLDGAQLEACEFGALRVLTRDGDAVLTCWPPQEIVDRGALAGVAEPWMRWYMALATADEPPPVARVVMAELEHVTQGRVNRL